MKQPAVYLMASQRNGTLYAGVTSNLVQRAGQHRAASGDGFAARNNCTQLVYFELHASMSSAIMREKQNKAGSRARKLTPRANTTAGMLGRACDARVVPRAPGAPGRCGASDAAGGFRRRDRHR